MPRNRRTGVTLLEIMTVLTLAAIMMAMAFPRLSESRRTAQLAAARGQVETYLSVARSIAVRNGGKTQLVRNGNKLTIESDTGTGWVTMVKPLKLGDADVGLNSTTNVIAFDARGLATGLSATGEKFYLKIASGYGSNLQDSICVTRLGGVLDRSCGSAAAGISGGGSTGGGGITVTP
jgi:Tfp pilus assembly protein FimT